MIGSLFLAAGLTLVSAANMTSLVQQSQSDMGGTASPTPFWSFNLRKPNNVNDFWYDVCLVNGLKTKKFHDSDKFENLNRLKRYYGIDDNSIANILGDVYINEQKDLGVVDDNVSKVEFTNGSDAMVEWRTPARTLTLKNSTSWTVNSSISDTMKIKYLWGSQKISINLASSHSQDVETSETKTYPSQTFAVKPHSKATLETKVWSQNKKMSGGVQYKMDWNNKQYVDFRYNNNKKSIRVNVGWTLLSIAKDDPTRTNFTRTSRDLFIFENNTFYLNLTETWESNFQNVEYRYTNN